MLFGHSVLLLAALVGTVARPVQAQDPQPIAAARPLRFESWQAASAGEVSTKLGVDRLFQGSRNRTRQALLGGVIGAAAGVAVCTVFSTLIHDSAKGGLSFCPLDTNLLFGGAGFVLGAVIGWSI